MKTNFILTSPINGGDYEYCGEHFVCRTFINKLKPKTANNIRLHVSSTAPKSKGWKKIKLKSFGVGDTNSCWFYVWVSGNQLFENGTDTLIYHSARCSLQRMLGAHCEYVFWMKVEDIN